MPSSEKKTRKDLHLASSVGELNKLADPGLPVDRNANPVTYIKSADKVYLKAQSHDVEGDEENAYVFYMRFFNIICLIKKSSKYTEKKKYYDDLMGKTKTIRSIDRAEALQKSLNKRYDKLKTEKEAKAKAEEEAKKKEEEDKKKLASEKANSRNGADSDSDLDSLLNGSGISSSADVYQKLKVSHSAILMPKTSENTDGALISGLETPSFSSKPTGTDGIPCVSAQDLYNLLTGENASKVLVLDCRPHSMFLQNCINRPSCINIPAELLDQGVSAGSIERRLREDTRRIWNKRGEREFVILMDESTKVADVTPECRIQRLKDVIFTFDSYSSLKNEPLFLDGGFHSWLWHYPSIALKPELPKVMSQPKTVTPVDLSSLDYPELPEEKTSSPPEPQLSPSPEAGPSKGSLQYPTLPSAGLENVHGTFVNPNGDNDQAKGELPNSLAPFHSNSPLPGLQLGEQASAVAPASGLSPLHKPGPGPKFEQPAIHPAVPQSQTGVQFSRPSDMRPSLPPNVPSSQPGAPLLRPSNPPSEASGPQFSVGSASQSFVPNPAGPLPPAPVPNTKMPHPSNQPIFQPGVPGSGPPITQTTQPSSLPSAAVPKPFSTSASFPSPSSIPSSQPGIPLSQPANSQSTPHSRMSSSGLDGARQILANSGPNVSPVPGSQPLTMSSTSSIANSVTPTPRTSATALPPSSTAAPQPSSQPSMQTPGPGVVTPSVPGQMPHQVPQSAQPGYQPQVPPVRQVPPDGVQVTPDVRQVPANGRKVPPDGRQVTPDVRPLPPDGRQVPGQSSFSATQPQQTASTSIPGADPRKNQHGEHGSPHTSQVPPYSTVSGSTQHSPQKPNQIPGNSQVAPRDAAKQPGREFTQPVDQKAAKPSQQSLPNKASGYITTPGLPPGWERIATEERPYYKDHNTQTTHWEPPKVPTTGANVIAPQSSAQKQQHPQMKRQSSVDKPTLRRSLSSPNLAKLSDQGLSAPKTPVVDRLSKPDEQTVSLRPIINRGAKPLSANQLDSFNPSYGGQGAALTGLRNLGNTCYMNSVVQCLSSVAPLAAFFISGAYREDINKSNRDGTRGELAENFSVLIRVLHSGQFKCISPGVFKRTVGKFKSQFSGYDQQDSQELLAFLMDGLQEDLNKVKQKPYLKAPDDELDPATAARIAWENHKKRNESIMVELFDGLFMSTVKCMVCLKESRTFDTFSNLTLPLPSHVNRCTLQDCLNLFTKPEKMSGDDKWFCPKCKQRREASKTIQIWRLPAILVVHLKRFQYEGMWRQKLQTGVSFPMTQLDMSNYVVGPKSTTRYSLHAVSNHYGTMHGGHYTAFAKCVYDRKWYKFDDQYVTEMSTRDIVTSAGYLLFYTSFDFQPPKYLIKS